MRAFSGLIAAALAYRWHGVRVARLPLAVLVVLFCFWLAPQLAFLGVILIVALADVKGVFFTGERLRAAADTVCRWRMERDPGIAALRDDPERVRAVDMATEPGRHYGRR